MCRESRPKVAGCDAAGVDEGTTYREVSRPGTTYPMMSISTVEDIAVVHLFPDEATCYLLGGDGVVEHSESRAFRILDIDAPFTGAFICNATRAQSVVERFARGIDPDDLGTWTLL
jgi:hypothetical protein